MKRNTNILTAFVLAAGALAASVTGCELIASVDRSLINTGTGGTGGAGASTSSSTGSAMCMGGATSCTTVADCPAPAACVTASCDMGCCTTAPTGDGVDAPTASQTAGDCKKVVCDGAGATKSATDDTDVPNDSNPCTDDTCSGGTPSNAPVAGQCTLSGNPGVCGDPAGSAKGTCVACNVGSDCTVSGVCQANMCVPQTCTDTVKNGSETDVDCGGSCGPCLATKKCLIDADCADKICDATAKTCTLGTCSDNVQNQGETDKDCGGTSTCARCGTGKKCVAAADCADGVCDATAKTCTAPTCNDGVKNQAETDLDCGGTNGCNKCANNLGCGAKTDCQSGFCDSGTNKCAACTLDTQCQPGGFCNGGSCAPTQGNGTLCAGGNGNQCTSGHCTDGVCCDKACGGTCEACTGVLKGSGTDGVCESIAAGTDPQTECPQALCTGTQFSAATTCNGSATTPACTTAVPVQCAPFVCQTTGCTTTCATNGDCASGDFCYHTGGGAGTKTCHTDQCTDGATDGTETDLDCGGSCSTKCADTKNCSVNGDCTGTFCYVTGGGAGQKTCHSNQCSDNATDGTETDVDCGGSCSTCANTKNCSVAGDCTSGICYKTGGGAGQKTCQANLCANGAQDTGETDTDCGGTTCGKCADTKKCTLNTDCTGNFCYVTGGGAGQKTCHSNQCSDGVKNNAETDLDCGGGTCSGCADGLVCAADTDCVSTDFCDIGGTLLCTTKLGMNVACTRDAQCQNGTCNGGSNKCN
jgi:hypothetical protein